MVNPNNMMGHSQALGRSVDCETIDWLVDLKTQRPKCRVGRKPQCRMYTKAEFIPRLNIHQGRIPRISDRFKG